MSESHIFIRYALLTLLFMAASTRVFAVNDESSPMASKSPVVVLKVQQVEAAKIAQFEVKLTMLDILQEDLKLALLRIASLEESIQKASEKTDHMTERNAWFALATVIAAGLISIVLQLLLLRHQQKIYREQAKSEVSNSYVEWQLKQLSEFYGPLRALLEQSNAMYRQMNRALVSANPDLFRMQSAHGKDFDNTEFQIKKDGDWTRFRTVKHLGDVYNKGYGIEPYFDDVVDIGSRMATLIRDKAGFARPEDNALIEVMGTYLAHYAVLSRLHKKAQEGVLVSANMADDEAVFPIHIQNLVNGGYQAINDQIIQWRSNHPK